VTDELLGVDGRVEDAGDPQCMDGLVQKLTQREALPGYATAERA
jgi:hypothetical protein